MLYIVIYFNVKKMLYSVIYFNVKTVIYFNVKNCCILLYTLM